MIGATMWKEQELKARFVHGTCRLVGPRGSAVERQSLAIVLLPSCTRPTYVGKLSAIDQPTRPTQPFILLGSINE